ncbi:MAG: Tim44 domain-containing protein [Magnetospirillum sp.]|nr:Tim44 domain-containing protein [Magnetospirillum sp.]
MNDGFHLLDLLFFAVAAFVVLRLRSVLGRRTGSERPAPPQWQRPTDPASVDNVIDLAAARKPAAENAAGPPVGGVAAIAAVDGNFTPDSFLAGARTAFEMIVSAYAAGDKTALRPLLADEVYRPFAAAIDARERDGERLETELVAIRKAEIVSAGLQGSVAVVTVRFVSDQVNLIKDDQGRIVEGHPDRVTDVTDEWTFRRDTLSPDPNWQLAATRSPDDDQD